MRRGAVQYQTLEFNESLYWEKRRHQANIDTCIMCWVCKVTSCRNLDITSNLPQWNAWGWRVTELPQNEQRHCVANIGFYMWLIERNINRQQHCNCSFSQLQGIWVKFVPSCSFLEQYSTQPFTWYVCEEIYRVCSTTCLRCYICELGISGWWMHGRAPFMIQTLHDICWRNIPVTIHSTQGKYV